MFIFLKSSLYIHIPTFLYINQNILYINLYVFKEFLIKLEMFYIRAHYKAVSKRPLIKGTKYVPYCTVSFHYRVLACTVTSLFLYIHLVLLFNAL